MPDVRDNGAGSDGEDDDAAGDTSGPAEEQTGGETMEGLTVADVEVRPSEVFFTMAPAPSDCIRAEARRFEMVGEGSDDS